MTVKCVSMRDAYGEALVELGGKHKNLVVLDADVSHSTNTIKFAEKYPKHFINIGCAEQNLIGTAAGLAKEGKIVFASSFAIFASGRGWEQIRNIVAHDKLKVNIVATHAGLSVGADGSSHQALEDISIMRAIPGMTVLAPADAIETKALISCLPERPGPSYMRLARPSVPLIYDGNFKPEIGKAVELEDGSDVAIVSCGILVSEAMKASKILSQKYHTSARVLDSHTIKPLDVNSIVSAAKETGALVTAEEHSVFGGLGSAVAEAVARNHPVPVEILGVKDRFGESGKPEELLEEYGLTSRHITEAALAAVKRR